jgi:hypothetical protein
MTQEQIMAKIKDGQFRAGQLCNSIRHQIENHDFGDAIEHVSTLTQMIAKLHSLELRLADMEEEKE